MALRDGYCTEIDLMLSGTRLPQGSQITAAQVIANTADEIDAAIGQLYVTPIVVEENDSTKRHDTLVLKRINAVLASGRLITAMATGGEQNRVQAYGEYLLRFAYALIQDILTGKTPLTSATEVAQTDSNALRRGPLLVQGNQGASLVDAFYENFQPGGFAPGRQNTSDDPWPNESACPSWMI